MENNDCNLNWNTCPPEILFKIFHMLVNDVETFSKCFLVSRTWRNIADYISQKRKLWEHLLLANLKFRDLVAMYKDTSSELTSRNLFYNVLHLRSSLTPNVSLENIRKNLCVRNMNVYKGKLCITREDLSECENLTDYRETHSYVIKASAEEKGNYFKLFVQIKDIRNQNQLRNFTFCNVCFYIINDNVMYVLDKTNCIVTCTLRHWEETAITFIARYYGHVDNVETMHLHNGTIYLLLKNGNLLKTTKYGMHQVSRIYMPHVALSHIRLFSVCSVVAGVQNLDHSQLILDEETSNVMLLIPGLSHVANHADLLLVGCNDGTVEIYSVTLLHRGIKEPKIRLNVTTFDPEIEDPKIVSICVAEERTAHKLFIAISDKIFEVLLTYPGYLDEVCLQE